MYDVKSRVATEFIDNKEILDTIAYAKQNKSNRKLIEQLIHRAKDCKGLTHREAAVLLECDQADLNEQMFHLAKQIKQNYTATVLLCLRRCICPIIVSTDVPIVLIIIRIKRFAEKN